MFSFASDKTWIQGHQIEMYVYTLAEGVLPWEEWANLSERVAMVSTDLGGVVRWSMEGHSNEIKWDILHKRQKASGDERSVIEGDVLGQLGE